MKVLTEGHKYLLDNFENKENSAQTIQFIEKAPIEPSKHNIRNRQRRHNK